MADEIQIMKNLIALLFVLGFNLPFFGQEKVLLNKVCYNTEFDDFGFRSINGKNYVVSASRDTLDGVRIVDEKIGRPFFDIYTVEQCRLIEAQIESKKKGRNLFMSSEFHDGPISIGKNGNILFFTCNQNFDNYSGTLGIYYAMKQGDLWSKPIPLPINSPDYSVSHPYYSDKEDKLYFISDKPGGKGGMDIYTIQYKFGEWLHLSNVAAANSPGNETFPFFTDKRLYFTTDRYKESVGLDIYFLEQDSITAKPISFNSKKDDLSIFFDKPDHGYISSRRDSLRSDDDIYEFTIQNQIIVEEVDSNIVAKVDTPEDIPDYSAIYALEGLRIRLKKLEQALKSESSKGLSIDFLGIMQKAIGSIESEIRNAEPMKKPAVDQEIARINSEISALEKLLEDELRKLNEKTDDPIVSNIENTNAANLLIDLAKVENVLFETNKWIIPEENKKELSAVASLLKTNSSWKIKVSGHTDNVGGAEYNMTLSKNRAESVKKYLVSQGISSGRISVEYFGLTKPVASNETEEGRLKNRRVELFVESNSESYKLLNWETLDAGAVHYKVQLLTSSKKLELSSPMFNGLPRVEEIVQDKTYKYFAGKSVSLDAAKSNQKILINAGFSGAFVVPFEGDKRISLEEALKKLK